MTLWYEIPQVPRHGPEVDRQMFGVGASRLGLRPPTRRTRLSRNTVKKYLRAGDEQRRYAKRTSSSKLDPYAEKLATVLAIEARDRASKRPLRSDIYACRTRL